MSRKIVIIAHNSRSAHNIGAIFRTADGFGIEKVILSGYSPYPVMENDTRLPHISQKLTSQIAKTALGAEKTVPFAFVEGPEETISQLRADGYSIAGLEQDKRSIMLPQYRPPQKVVLVLGEEVYGMAAWLRDQCDVLLEIPMQGMKESFNLSVATGIALYAITSQ